MARSTSRLSNFRFKKLLKKSVSWYMRTLEELTIRVLKEYDIKGSRIKGLTGVWVEIKKLQPKGYE